MVIAAHIIDFHSRAIKFAVALDNRPGFCMLLSLYLTRSAIWCHHTAPENVNRLHAAPRTVSKPPRRSKLCSSTVQGECITVRYYTVPHIVSSCEYSGTGIVLG